MNKEIKCIVYISMILVCLGCTKSNEPEIPDSADVDTTKVCIHSLEQLTSSNGGLNIFQVSRVALEDGSEIITGGTNPSVKYRATASTAKNSLFDSTLIIRVMEDEVLKTYTATVWSKGCKYTQEDSEHYTNLVIEGRTYKVNTYFNWVASPYGASSPRIKYLIVN